MLLAWEEGEELQDFHTVSSNCDGMLFSDNVSFFFDGISRDAALFRK